MLKFNYAVRALFLAAPNVGTVASKNKCVNLRFVLF